MHIVYRFDNAEIDETRHELRVSGVVKPLEPQVFDLLCYLVRNAGRLVSRDELLDAIWHGRPVSDATLSSRIKAVRQALGDSGARQSLIQTVPRRGFRFVAEVEIVSDEALDPPHSSPELEAPVAGRPSIAVLPFANLSDDADQAYFADGMVEDIISALSKFEWLLVIARSSTAAYKNNDVDVRHVAQELNVRYVLEGSVRRYGDRLRTVAQLVDGESGTEVWTERYDRGVEDLFAVQDELTASIVAAIAPEITQVEIVRARKTSPEHLDAWGFYQRGLAYLPSGTEDGFHEAIAFFDRARAADPSFVDAIAFAAFMRSRLAMFFIPQNRDELMQEAHELLVGGLRLDNRNCAVNLALGRWHSARSEHEHAIARARTAVDINPNSTRALHELGNCLLRAGSFEESLSTHRQVLELSPRDIHLTAILTGMAHNLFYLERLEEALDAVEVALRDANPRWWARSLRAAILHRMGREPEAAAAVKQVLAIRPELTLRDLSFQYSDRCVAVVEAFREMGLPAN